MSRRAKPSLVHGSRVGWPAWRRAVRLIISRPECSAKLLLNELELGSYRTAWRVSLRVRMAMAQVSWPPLRGEVEIDECAGIWLPSPHSIWVAIERPTEIGLVAAWCNQSTLKENVVHARERLTSDAIVIAPRSVQFKGLASSHRLRTNDERELREGRQFLERARTQLRDRKQRRLNRKTLEAYLGEMVFRHNARAHGWSHLKQQSAVLRALREPSA